MALLRYLLCFTLSFSLTGTCLAQPELEGVAGRETPSKSTLSSLREAYYRNPYAPGLYQEYLDALLAAKEFKTAEALVNSALEQQGPSPLLLIDLGAVYEAAGKKKKAEEQYEAALGGMSGDDNLTRMMAAAFQRLQKPELAIRVYEQAAALYRNAYIYYGPLSRLYAQTNQLDKAVGVILDAAPGMRQGPDEAKASLLQMIGSDAGKLRIAQKAIVKKINEQPNNPYFAELLTWVYTMKDDWDGALMQIEALDLRNKEDGSRLLSFARFAITEKAYKSAFKALDAVMEKGAESPFYTTAAAQKLAVGMELLENDPAFTPAQVAALEKEFYGFLTRYPEFYVTQTALDFARLEARFANRPDSAIAILKTAIATPGASRQFTGQAKLQLGDYQVLTGQVWDASLTYSQVDKAFREDMLGEEARFRNARLAYYRGDFDWAQGQLSVLKSATSELIANDALFLSVLITENVTPDSNLTPLKRFAYADLLLFQNKDNAADQLLDSIALNFPEHPLQDDILLLRARIARKHKDYPQALAYLKQIIDRYGEDVLADDALFQTAAIYETDLKEPEKARAVYEQLILNYPGSTFVQTARKKLAALSGGSVAP